MQMAKTFDLDEYFWLYPTDMYSLFTVLLVVNFRSDTFSPSTPVMRMVTRLM